MLRHNKKEEDLPSYGGLDVSGPDDLYGSYTSLSGSGRGLSGSGRGLSGSGRGSRPTPSYSGYDNDGGEYKDKPRKSRYGSLVEQLLRRIKEPQIWPVIASIFFFIMTLNYRSKYNSVLRIMDVTKGGVREAQNAWDAVIRARDNKGRTLSNLQEQQRKIVQKQTTCDVEKRQLTKERDELRMKYQSPDKLAEQKRLMTQSNAYQERVNVLQSAISRQAKYAAIEKYGPGPHYVEFTVELETLPEGRGTFVVEMAPLNLMPHSVYVFLEQVNRKLWSNAWFYVNGPHVVQAGPKVDDEELEKAALEGNTDERSIALRPFTEKNLGPLAFQEYSEEYPHVAWTLGFTGRPSGPDWYINKIDNTVEHGPGGLFNRGDDEEADPCFAKIVNGLDVVKAITAVPVSEDDAIYKYFYDEPIHIVNAIIVPGPKGSKDGTKTLSVESEEQQKNATETIDTEDSQMRMLRENLLQLTKGEALTAKEEQWVKMAEQFLLQKQQSQEQAKASVADVTTGDVKVLDEALLSITKQEQQLNKTTSSNKKEPIKKASEETETREASSKETESQKKTPKETEQKQQDNEQKQRAASGSGASQMKRRSMKRKRKFKKPLIDHMVEP